MKNVTLLFMLCVAGILAAAEPRRAIADRELASLYVAAIRHVASSRRTDRPQVFVMPQELLQHVSKGDRGGISIVGDAPPFSFPSQKSSDRGGLYLKVEAGEVELDRDQASANFGFFIGVENSATWHFRFQKSLRLWRVVSAEIVARS